MNKNAFWVFCCGCFKLGIFLDVIADVTLRFGQLVRSSNRVQVYRSRALPVCFQPLSAEISAGEKVGIKMFPSVY